MRGDNLGWDSGSARRLSHDVISLFQAVFVSALVVLAISFSAPAQAQQSPLADARAADTAAEEGDFDRAIDLYSNAISSGQLTQHNLAAVHFNRGGTFLQMGRPADAVLDFTQTVLLRPDHPRAWANRGLSLQALGDFENALSDFTQALEVGTPDDAEVYNLRGGVHRDLGDYQAAVEDYTTALEFRDAWPFALRNRARAKYYLGDFRDAARDFEAAYDLERDPYTSIWRFLSIARLGSTDQAVSQLGRETRRLREDLWPAPVVRMFLGEESPDSVLLAARNPDSPDHSAGLATEALFYIGQLFLLQGDEKQAQAFFERVLQLGVFNFFEYSGAQAELARLSR